MGHRPIGEVTTSVIRVSDDVQGITEASALNRGEA